MESRSPPQSELHNGEETPRLPELVIIEEILPRLPVKSLLKFRCVSKSWCSLIGSKRFMKAHLKNTIERSWFGHRLMLFDCVENEFKQCCLPSLFDKSFTVADPISHISGLGIDKSDTIILVGSCNGLVCLLLNWKRFILWNPSTKKFRYLPDLYYLVPIKCGMIETYGFEYDELSDDYRVFGIVNQLTGPAPHCMGMLYSLRSNSWKHIEETNFSRIKGEGIGMRVSGKFHWLDNTGYIVSLDLNSLVSQVVDPPSYAVGNLHRVRAFGGCLSAHFVQPNGDLDVWLMKEYGVKESWDKVVTIPWGKVVGVPYEFQEYFNISTPVDIAPNGEVLLICDSIVIYNEKRDVVRHLHTTGLSDEFYSSAIYIESLAPVAPDDE